MTFLPFFSKLDESHFAGGKKGGKHLICEYNFCVTEHMKAITALRLCLQTAGIVT